MNINYTNFRIKNLELYKTFNPSNADLIFQLCNSNIFPSGIIITGKIGVGKSTFAEVLTNYFYQNENNYNKFVLIVDTPVENSAQLCRDILQKAIRIKHIYNKRIFIILDEAHILSFAAQQVFLSSLERENNITIIFITNDIEKVCDALQNRCLIVEILPFNNKDQIHKFAKFIIDRIPNPNEQIINNYNHILRSLVFKISGRDIINAIIYSNFEAFDEIDNNINIQQLESYIDDKIKKSSKINIENILEILSNILLSKSCLCKDIKYECKTCIMLNTFIKLHSFVTNIRSLKMLIRLLSA